VHRVTFLKYFKITAILHDHDTRAAVNYSQLCARTNIRKQAIMVRGPLLWNVIPVSLKKITTFSTFIFGLKDFLLNKENTES